MDKDRKPEQSDGQSPSDEKALLTRRDFLVGLKKWSTVVIGGAVLGGLLLPPTDAEAGAWINNRGGWGGGGWINGGGGGSWINGGGGGGWVNRGGGGGWVNRGGGGGWVNHRGGGGGSWINRR